jgi:hypothetical protein
MDGSQGGGMTIQNETDVAVTVVYVEMGKEMAVADLDPGGATNEVEIFHGMDRGCLLGTLIARDKTRVVDELNQPCVESLWFIEGP